MQHAGFHILGERRADDEQQLVLHGQLLHLAGDAGKFLVAVGVGEFGIDGLELVDEDDAGTELSHEMIRAGLAGKLKMPWFISKRQHIKAPILCCFQNQNSSLKCEYRKEICIVP